MSFLITTNNLVFDELGVLSKPLTCVIANKTKTPVKIVGVRSSCSCTIVEDDLPKVVSPGGVLALPVVISPPESGDFAGSVDIYTDDPVARILTFSFSGRVDRTEGIRTDPH